MLYLSRRNFITIGSAVLGSSCINLPKILQAQENNGKHKALINIFLAGGPPHLDLWDLKPDAPQEIRGAFNPIKTNVNGIEICEVFEKLAKRMDKCTIIRSITGSHGDHASFQCMTGWKPDSLKNIGGRPSIGSVVTKLQGPVDSAVPPYVGLAETTKHIPWSDSGSGGFLGPIYNPFKPSGKGLDDMILKGSLDRLAERKNLLSKLDNMRREIDNKEKIASADEYTQKSFDILTDSKLLNALDLSKVDSDTLAMYGDGKPFNFQYDGAPTDNSHLLMAKRLIEAGVRVVSLSYGRWDSHGNNFDLVKDHGTKLDQCLSALIDDLERSELLDTTTVIVWGEFGRTPKINQDAGRDHWPQVNSALLLGGGMRHGQVIGSTNKNGEVAQNRPVDVQEVVSTLYHSLGIDTSQTTIIDTTGRPQYLSDYNPIRELV
jgi:hypothetical protein